MQHSSSELGAWSGHVNAMCNSALKYFRLKSRETSHFTNITKNSPCIKSYPEDENLTGISWKYVGKLDLLSRTCICQQINW